MLISPAFAQDLHPDDSGTLTSLLPLILILGIVFFVLWLRKRKPVQTHETFLQQEAFRQQETFLKGGTVIKTYTGSQTEAIGHFKVDATGMAGDGYFPTSQAWAPGQWSAGAFIVAVLLIFLFGLGILILAYMLIVKPDGTLTVTYERRTALFEEKTCPICAERIKTAALVCHFCGHKFTPEELVAQHDAQLAAQHDVKLAAQQNSVKAEFTKELNDYLYRVEKDGRVSAVNGLGERVQFHDWESFWKAATRK